MLLPSEVDMTPILINLPDETVSAARDAGLLTPEALQRLLTHEVARLRAATAVLGFADRVSLAGVDDMPMTEIDAEVKAVRHERRRAGGH
jgi:hypothetical protein